MTVKETKSRELAVGEDCVERYYRKYLDKATYGITLRGNVVGLWKEEEGGRRQIVACGTLTDGETGWVREIVANIRRFAQFGALFSCLRDELGGAHVDPHL
jgi:hypothetical protein